MRFNVPKYIDIEDKIFGPLTFKQFVYLAGGAGLCTVVFWLSPSTVISLPIVALIAGFSLALAFWNFNGKPFIHTVKAMAMFLVNTRVYVWKHREHEDKSRKQLNKELEQIETSMQNMNNDTIKKKSVSVTVGGQDTSLVPDEMAESDKSQS